MTILTVGLLLLSGMNAFVRADDQLSEEEESPQVENELKESSGDKDVESSKSIKDEETNPRPQRDKQDSSARSSYREESIQDSFNSSEDKGLEKGDHLKQKEPETSGFSQSRDQSSLGRPGPASSDPRGLNLNKDEIENLHIENYNEDERGQYILKMKGPTQQGWLDELKRNDVEIVNYMNDMEYRVRTLSSNINKVEKLSFVEDFRIYQPIQKIDRNVEIDEVIVTLDSSASPSSNRAIGGRNLDQSGSSFVVEVESKNDLFSLARDNDVLSIEKNYRFQLHDETSSEIVGGYWAPNASYNGPGNYANELGHNGSSVTVSITDTGIGDGTAGDAGHQDFTGRVIGGVDYSGEGTWNDVYAHGTHTAGLVAGDTYHGRGTTYANTSYLVGQGVAPETRLFSQRIFDDSGTYGSPDLDILFEDANNNGVDVHSNSWGAPTDGEYTSYDRIYDSKVRDADINESGDQPMVITMSAGNAGPYSQTTGSPGNAKNVITVGAAENYHPDLESYGNDVISGMDADNPEEIADFSSRGPTEDDRIKPDVVAPGRGVLSTRSPDGLTPLYGTYTEDPNYLWCSGTSMSNPVVAGAASVVVDWYKTTYGVKPSPSMVKALLVNTAQDLNDTENTAPIPNYEEGWGKAYLPPIVDPPVNTTFDDQTNRLQTGDEKHYIMQHDNPNHPLNVTLTWTDAPSSSSNSVHLMNDLDIKVIDPAGKTWYGNSFQNGMSVPDTASSWDHDGDNTDDRNNVVNVFIPENEIVSGPYTIVVEGENIAADGVPSTPAVDQDYALAVYNVEKYQSDEPIIQVYDPSQEDVWASSTVKPIKWASAAGNGTKTVDLSYSTDNGTTWTSIVSGTPDDGIYNWTVPYADSEECRIKAVIEDSDGDLNTSLSEKFEITPVKIDVVSPNGGEIFLGNSERDILWNTAGGQSPKSINLWYSLNNGSNWTSIVSGTADTGNYSWSVPNLNTTEALIKAKVVDDNSDNYTDISDMTFRIWKSYDIPFYDDIESVHPAWRHYNISGEDIADNWHVNDTRSADSVNSWHSGMEIANWNNGGDTALETPPLALNTTKRLVNLEFDHWYNFSDNPNGPGDGGIVEVWDNVSQNWTKITPDSGYPNTLATGFDNPLEGEEAFTRTSDGWEEETFDLTPFIGRMIRLRFHVGWDYGTYELTEGWFIDNVFVRPPPEHDIEVEEMSVPETCEVGKVNMIEGIISNEGLNNETNIGVDLLADGSVVNSTVIPSLTFDNSTHINLGWYPSTEKNYTLGLHALPVTDENYTVNNWLNRTLYAEKVPDIWTDPSEFNFTLEAGKEVQENLTLNNSGLADLDYDIYEIDETHNYSGQSDVRESEIHNYHSYDVDGDGIDDEFKNITIYAASSDGDTLNVTVNGWDGKTWTNIYDGSGGSRYVVDGDYLDQGYTEIEIILNDTENNDDVIYGYEYKVVEELDWLTANPDSGTLSPGDQTNVSVQADSSPLSPGTYHENLTILSNDPDESELTLPVNLTVTPAPHDIRVADMYLPDHGVAGTQIMVSGNITNNGQNDESGIDVELFANGALQNSTTISSLAVGDSVNVTMNWTTMSGGDYLVELYAVPVTGENHTYDNILNETINVTVEPEVWVDPPEYDFTLEAGKTGTDNLTIGNSGLDDLDFKLFDDLNSKFNLGDYTIEERSSNWVDGVSGGTALGLTDDDYASVSLPFSFDFYNGTFNDLYICSNGWASFTDAGLSYPGNETIPNQDWDQTIFPLGDDWNPSSGGDVYYDHLTSPNRFVVTWNDVPHYSTGGTNTFQMVMYESGEIDFNYDRLETEETFTVGVNQGDGVNGTKWMQEPQDGDSLRVYRHNDCLWLDEKPKNGSITPSGQTNVTVTVNTSILTPGTYHADIFLQNNDPDEGMISIPVNLTVTPPPHDITVSDMGAPDHGVAGTQIMVSGNITNNGQNDESGIDVELYADGVLQNSTTIPSLAVGDSVNVTMNWTAMSAGDHLVKLFAVPVTGENYTVDNSRNINVNVTEEPDICVSPQGYDFTINRGQNHTDTLVVDNEGMDVLNYSVNKANYSGRSNTTQSDIHRIFEYDINQDGVNDVFDQIYLFANSSDSQNLNVTVNGWNGHSWNTIYKGTGGSRVVVHGDYLISNYSKLEVIVDDTDDNDDIFFDYDYTLQTSVEWLEVTPDDGTVPVEDQNNLTLELDTSDFTPGSYTTNISIENNDPRSDLKLVPVNLTITPNNKPNQPINPTPADGATQVSTSPTLSVDVSDPDGDEIDVYFHKVSDGSRIGKDMGVANNTTASVTWDNMKKQTGYISWYAVASDGFNVTQSSTWIFTTEDVTTPSVENNTPLNYAEKVAVNTSITLRFSEPMNEQSVEDNFAISPEVNGTFSWNTNSTLLTYQLDEEMESRTNYRVIIDSDASDQNGLSMLSYHRFSFTTEDFLPSVEIHNPSAGDEYEVGSNVFINWTAEDDSILLSEPITIKVSYDGGDSWMMLEQSLENTGTYQLTVDNVTEMIVNITCEDSAGQTTMNTTGTFSIVDTVPPTVENMNPSDNKAGIDTDQKITIEFNEPVNNDSLEINVTDEKGQEVSGSWTLSEDNKTLTFIPDEELEPGTDYTVSLSAEDEHGNLREYVSSFTTEDNGYGITDYWWIIALLIPAIVLLIVILTVKRNESEEEEEGYIPLGERVGAGSEGSAESSDEGEFSEESGYGEEESLEELEILEKDEGDEISDGEDLEELEILEKDEVDEIGEEDSTEEEIETLEESSEE